MTKTVSCWTRSAALLLLTFVGLGASPAAAYYSEACWVRAAIYPYGLRPYRNYSRIPARFSAVKCNYVTGMELNARAGFKRFDDDGIIYVVILWPRAEPTYIRISQPQLLFCGEVAEPDCAESIAGRLTGDDHRYDSYGRLIRRTWDICQPGFIDRDCYKALGWRD